MIHTDLEFAAAVATDRAQITQGRFIAAIVWLGETLESINDECSTPLHGLGCLLSLLAEKAGDDSG